MNRKKPMTKADDVRETPATLFEARDALHRFDLDACALHANAKCPCYYMIDGHFDTLCGERTPGDGLTGAWYGNVWCNPPFSELWIWVAKAWRECARSTLCDAGEVNLIDFLMPATRCEQSGWQKLVEPYRDGRATLVPGWRLDTTFLPGRQHFLKDGQPILNPKTGLKSSPKFGCVMLTWTRKP